MQNRVGELYSLIRFLRIFPYAFYFCGAGTAKTSKVPPCDCRSLDHPFKQNHRKCDHCGCVAAFHDPSAQPGHFLLGISCCSSAPVVSS